MHTREDESFICLAGKLDVHLGGEDFTLGTGDYLYLPRDVVHTFRNTYDEEARVISVVSPAGLEAYYQALADLPPGPKDIDKMKQIMADFGIVLQLPPEVALTMRVAIIGAGVAGLATAKVLTQAGHEVVVYDKAPDVGGVWSRTRRYPGLTTQSPKAQYSPVGLPHAARLPRVADRRAGPGVPRGVREPLRAGAALRLSTEVTAAAPVPDGGWAVHRRRQADRALRPAGGGQRHLLRARRAALPGRGRVHRGRRPGAGGHRAARRGAGAGQARARRRLRQVGLRRHGAGQPGGGEHRRHRPAAAVEGAAARSPGCSTSRCCCSPAWARPCSGTCGRAASEKFLHGPGNGMRGNMINSIGSASVRQFGLQAARPGAARADGGHRPRRDRPGHRGLLRGRRGRPDHRAPRTGPSPGCSRDDGTPAAELDDGTRLPADLVVCATGFTQGVPFLPADVAGRLLDERGNFLLYRQIRPVDVPGLYFNGYNSSFFSPLNAEMAAVWIAADLAGAVGAAGTGRDAPGRSPSSSRSWTSPPTPTTAAAARSSRSRCTTSTRCSATSA